MRDLIPKWLRPWLPSWLYHRWYLCEAEVRLAYARADRWMRLFEER